MHNIYTNGEDFWTKTILATLNVLVKWKGGNNPPENKYESREGVTLKTKGNLGGFRGD